MDLLLHPPEDSSRHTPDARGRLSTVGHRGAFRAFARAARRAGIRFMVIGGTFRDVMVRAASTRDIDIVLVDTAKLPADVMRSAGFVPGPSPHTWRYMTEGQHVELQVAAIASSTDSSGPFSIAYRDATRRTIEGIRVAVPRVEDYVILKLIAAQADSRRRARDRLDIQHTLGAFPDQADGILSVAALRARLRDVYRVQGDRLKQLTALVRLARRQLKGTA